MEPLRGDLHQHQQRQLSLVATLPALIGANNGTNIPEATVASTTSSAATKTTTGAATITATCSNPTLATTATTISATTNAATAFSGSSIAHQNLHQMQHHSPNLQHQHQHNPQNPQHQHPQLQQHQYHHHQPQLQQQHSISATSSSTIAATSIISGGGVQQTIEKLSRPAAFDKMESLVREMQDPENGVPVRQQKMFLTSIPYAFMGYDLIEWLMDRLLIEESEALNIANQLCLHGYFFPVNDTKTLVVKDDSSLYRFQTPYYWPWQHKAPDNVEYAIYLAKRSLRNKQRHALEDYETEALSSLHKNLKGKWDIISMQAEEQVRLAKERKKGDKIVGDSQERAYWRVHRPPPGQFTPLEPCPVPMRDRQGTKPKKKSLEDVQREVDYLRKTINRTRMKMSQACESLVNYAETFAEYDAFMQPPLPSNPWVTEDTTFWQLNNTYVEAPTEKRVRRWAISIEELVGDPTGLQEFTNFLEKEYSHENIRFWNEVNCLRRSSHSQVPRKATEIYEEFLMPGAPCEINIDSKTMASVLQALYNPSRFTFDSASEHIYTLLLKKDCYPRFIRSDHYKRLLENGVQPLHKKRFFNFGGVGGAKKKMTAALSGQATISESSTSKAMIGAAPPPGSLARRRGSDRSLTGSAHELAVIGVNKENASNKVPHSHSQSNLSEMPYSESVYRGDMPTRMVAMDACINAAHGLRDMRLRTTQDAPRPKLATRLETTAEATGNAVCPWDLSEEGPAPPPSKFSSQKATPAVPVQPVKKTSTSGTTSMQVQLSICPWEQDDSDPLPAMPTAKIVPPRLNSTSSDISEVSDRLQRTSLGIRHQKTVDSGEAGMKRLMPNLTEQRRASISFTPNRFSEQSLGRSAQSKTASTPSPTVGSQIIVDTTFPPLYTPLVPAGPIQKEPRDETLNNFPEETELPPQRLSASPSPSSTAESNSVATVDNQNADSLPMSRTSPQEVIEEPIKEVQIELIETTNFVDPCKSPQQDSAKGKVLSRSATPTINVQECVEVIATSSSNSNSNSPSPKSAKRILEGLHVEDLKELNEEKSSDSAKQRSRCYAIPPPLPPIGPMDEEELADEDGSIAQEELSPTTDEYQEGLQFGADSKDDYDYDIVDTDSRTGYIAPAPTPAPSMAPLAELDVDTVDDEPPLEEVPPPKSPVIIESNYTVETIALAAASVEEGRKRRKKRSSESKKMASLEEKEKATTSSVEGGSKVETERNTVCPWEDENVSPSDGTFVKTYATLGYL